MEALIVVVAVAVIFFVAGVVFGKRHAARIGAELAEAKQAYADLKAVADRLRQ